MDDFRFRDRSAWWFGYFVRYFIGAAVGILIVQYLVENSPVNIIGSGFFRSQIQNTGQPDLNVYYLWILVVTGLAFSYIASAPILVFHATRGILLSKFVADNKSIARGRISLPRSKGFVFSVTSSITAVLSCSFYFRVGNNIHFISQEMGEAVAIFFISSYLFSMQVFNIFEMLRSPDSVGFLYYSEVCIKRATATDSGREYMSSYRELREHGNAYFVLALEIILGLLLYFTPSYWLLTLLLWIFPAVCVWFMAVILESRNF